MIYQLTITQFTKMLQNLSKLFDQAVLHAEAKKFDPTVLLQSRLAPDQLPLMRQIHLVCDTAKLGVARLTGKEARVHEDTEKTIDEAKVRIQLVITYLQSFSEKDFAGYETRQVTTPRWNGKWLTGEEYALQHVIPNFYFHVTTAYAILRHNGVDIGKRHYLGEMPYKGG